MAALEATDLTLGPAARALAGKGLAKGAQLRGAFASTEGYRAPELETVADYSTKSDIYAFGIVLGEILERRLCSISNLCSKTYTPTVHERSVWRDLIWACTEDEPDERPSAKVCVETLSGEML